MNDFTITNGVLEACNTREPYITIPDGVHTIGTGAFKAFVNLEEVRLPDTVTHIMDHAFKGCRKLRTINFPDHLVHIGDYAFHRCHALERISLPPSVKALGNCVFLFCDHLVDAAIPGVTSLGKQVFFHDLELRALEISEQLDPACINDVFMGCSKLSEIRCQGGQTFAPDNMIALLSPAAEAPELVKAIARDVYRTMDIEDGRLNKFLTNLTYVDVPDGITALGKSCFFDKKGIISVTLPASLTHIDCRAFRNCINLKQMTFGNEDLTISEDAFKNCTTLKYIELPGGRRYELTGLPGDTDADAPALVRTIHAQILGNFLISGTMLIEYRGNEERVVVPDGITVISERAFAGNEAIDRIVLPDSVREIHEEAFADCLLLQKINLPDQLTRLGASAFENCVKLIRADLPDSVTILERSVFNRCAKLNAVCFGSQITAVGELAFYGCAALKTVRLPDTLLHLGDMAFYKCTGLKEILLPGSLRTIGSNVFTLSGIRSAVIEDNIAVWGSGVFAQCPRLRTLRLSDGVRHIGDRAAVRCPALKYVHLPKSLSSMGINPFEGSPFAETLAEQTILGTVFLNGRVLSGEVTVPEGITAIAGGAFYDNTAVTRVHLPESLIDIGAGAFGGCTGLSRITLPSGITAIEESTFARCDTLISISAGGNLTRIAARAFYGCTALADVSFPAAAFAEIGEDAFANTPLLQEQSLTVLNNALIDGHTCAGQLTIPNGISYIAPFAFAGNEALTGCVIPESMKVIGRGAFYGCRNLEAIDWTGGPERIEADAFAKCLSLRRIETAAAQIGARAFSFCTGLEEIRFSAAAVLEKEAFLGCRSLTHLNGEYLAEIGVRCFESCEALHTVVLGADVRLRAHAFEDCARLTQIRITGERISCGSYAFSGCTALERIALGKAEYQVHGIGTLFNAKIPTAVKELYQSAVSCFGIDEHLTLYRCSSRAKSLHIPKGVRTIDREVFRNAMQLEEVSIPSSVETIGSRAFHSTPWLNGKIADNPLVIVNDILLDATGCSGEVTIPATVKTISGWAFANCYGLTAVTYTSPQTITGEYAYRNCFNLRQITTADGKTYTFSRISDRDRTTPPLVSQIISDCYNCFKTDDSGTLTECTGNINQLVLAGGITAIGDQAFKESNLLTRITLSEDTTAIGKSAFADCKWLLQVLQAEQVARVEKQAFSGCVRLESVTFSENLQFIGERAFEHCVSLRTIILPEGITDIPAKAFYRCRNLESVAFPATLKTIGSQAFAYCPHLSAAAVPEGVSAAPDAFRKAVLQ